MVVVVVVVVVEVGPPLLPWPQPTTKASTATKPNSATANLATDLISPHFHQ
jgi:hypothetical protein